jgi:asparagine synthase (glutamine-hydrolysing)
VVCTIDDLLKRNKAEHSFETSAFKQKTFSARFPGFKRDEGKFMQMIINATNTEPHFVYPTEETLAAELDRVAYFQEEPFGGASILVQYEVMKLAKENDVTVLLDGQGADEILAGYHAYFNIFFRQLELNNSKHYKSEFRSYNNLHHDNPVNRLQKKGPEYYMRKWAPKQIGKIKRSKGWIDQKISKAFNDDFFSTYSNSVFDPENSFNDLNSSLYNSTINGDLQVLLRYADRNSMASSREVRLPFLSHQLVEFLFTLPPEFKLHNGWTKWIMREAFSDLLPPEICRRTDKIGYEPPQKHWMENSAIKERINESIRKLADAGILNKKQLNKHPNGHSASERGDKSWDYMMAGYLFDLK